MPSVYTRVDLCYHVHPPYVEIEYYTSCLWYKGSEQ